MYEKDNNTYTVEENYLGNYAHADALLLHLSGEGSAASLLLYRVSLHTAALLQVLYPTQSDKCG